MTIHKDYYITAG